MGQRRRACTDPRKLSPNTKKYYSATTKSSTNSPLKQPTRKQNKKASFGRQVPIFFVFSPSVLLTSEVFQYSLKAVKTKLKTLWDKFLKERTTRVSLQSQRLGWILWSVPYHKSALSPLLGPILAESQGYYMLIISKSSPKAGK